MSHQPLQVPMEFVGPLLGCAGGAGLWVLVAFLLTELHLD
jgi:hypothetical protein